MAGAVRAVCEGVEGGLSAIQVAHLITGPTGAGKTTYARKLGSDSKAQVFSIDEWMQTPALGDAEPRKVRTYEIQVDDRTFDWMESFIEAPGAEELDGGVVVTG